MVARLGNVLYWGACIAASLSFLAAFLIWLSPGQDWAQWFINYVAFGVFIWLVGRAVKYVLAGV